MIDRKIIIHKTEEGVSLTFTETFPDKSESKVTIPLMGDPGHDIHVLLLAKYLTANAVGQVTKWLKELDHIYDVKGWGN